MQKYEMDAVLQFIAALLMFCKIEVIWRNKLLQKLYSELLTVMLFILYY